ncbi:MAG: tetratricopeptide repeat protein [Candidatus Obscuribacter sp.]|nr:tetratricopeptide repeat protein [Candidatus Obscuribacter sp.]
MSITTNNYLLGELSVKLGAVSQEHVDKSLTLSADTGLPLGRVLVLSGLILEPDLTALIRCQTLLREDLIDIEAAKLSYQMAKVCNTDLDTALAQLGWSQKRERKIALLGELLVESEALPQHHLDTYLRQQPKLKLPLGRMLVSASMITEVLLGTALSIQSMIRQGRLSRAEGIEVLKDARIRLSQTHAAPKSKSFYAQQASNIPKIGELLVLSGLISESRLTEALELSIGGRKSIGEILLERRYLSKAQLDSILTLQSNLANGTLRLNQLKPVIARLEEGMAFGDALAVVLSDQTGTESNDEDLLSFFEFVKTLDQNSAETYDQAFELAKRNQRIVKQALLISGALDETSAELLQQCYSLSDGRRYTFDEIITLYEYAKRRSIFTKEAMVELRWFRKNAQQSKPVLKDNNTVTEANLLDLKEVAEQMILVRDYANALDMYTQLLTSLRKHQDNRYFYCLERASYVCCELANYTAAEAYQKEAKDLAKQIFGELNMSHAQAWSTLAKVHYFMGQVATAIEEATMHVYLLKKILGTNHPDVACGLQNLGMLHFQTGEQKESLRCYYEAHKICLDSLGASHPTTVNLLAKLTDLQSRLHESKPEESGKDDSDERGLVTGNWRTISFDDALSPLEG